MTRATPDTNARDLREEMMDCYQFGTVDTPDTNGEASTDVERVELAAPLRGGTNADCYPSGFDPSRLPWKSMLTAPRDGTIIVVCYHPWDVPQNGLAIQLAMHDLEQGRFIAPTDRATETYANGWLSLDELAAYTSASVSDGEKLTECNCCKRSAGAHHPDCIYDFPLGVPCPMQAASVSDGQRTLERLMFLHDTGRRDTLRDELSSALSTKERQC